MGVLSDRARHEHASSEASPPRQHTPPVNSLGAGPPAIGPVLLVLAMPPLALLSTQEVLGWGPPRSPVVLLLTGTVVIAGIRASSARRVSSTELERSFLSRAGRSRDLTCTNGDTFEMIGDSLADERLGRRVANPRRRSQVWQSVIDLCYAPPGYGCRSSRNS